MVSIGSAKALFDFDIVAGLIVAVIVDYAWAYLALKVDATAFLRTPIYGVFHYDDALVLVTDATVALLTKGRIRKIFIYALWFNIAFEIAEWSISAGGYTSPLIPMP
jgi:hypothetical protein